MAIHEEKITNERGAFADVGYAFLVARLHGKSTKDWSGIIRVTFGALLATGIVLILGLGFIEQIDPQMSYMLVLIILLGAMIGNSKVREFLQTLANRN